MSLPLTRNLNLILYFDLVVCKNKNALYAELSLLAYNIIIWFKRLCLPESWHSCTVGTLRHRLLLIPGVFTRGHNRPMLKLPRNNPYQDVIGCALEKIKKLPSLVE